MRIQQKSPYIPNGEILEQIWEAMDIEKAIEIRDMIFGILQKDELI